MFQVEEDDKKIYYILWSFYSISRKIKFPSFMSYFLGASKTIPFFSFCVNWIVKWEEILCAEKINYISVMQKEMKGVSQGLSRKTHTSAWKPLIHFLTACLEPMYSFLIGRLKYCCVSTAWLESCHVLWEESLPRPQCRQTCVFLPFFPPFWNLFSALYSKSQKFLPLQNSPF